MRKTLTPKNPSRVGLAVKLVIVAFMVAALVAANPVRATARFSCALGTFGGTTTRTLSCGSSAGNFVFACTSGICVNETDNQLNQAIADSLCRQYEQDGCPDLLSGGAIQVESPPVN